jgi:hypothetical protein
MRGVRQDRIIREMGSDRYENRFSICLVTIQNIKQHYRIMTGSPSCFQ